MAPLVRDSSQYLQTLLELLPEPPPSAPADRKGPSRAKYKKGTQAGAPNVMATGDISCTAKVIHEYTEYMVLFVMSTQLHVGDAATRCPIINSRQMDRWTDRQTDGQTDRQMDKDIYHVLFHLLDEVVL